MPAKIETGVVELMEAMEYARGILLKIDLEQAQIAVGRAATAAQRFSTKSRRGTATGRGQLSAPASSTSDSRAESSAGPTRTGAPEAPHSDTEKELRRRELSLRRKLDVQKWLAKYNTILMEASTEYRLGKLIKQIAGESESSVSTRIVEQFSDPHFGEKHKAEIERILAEGEILKALLPLLDPLPNI